MKKPAVTPDSLLKYAAGVSALVVVSESASAAPPVSNILSFSVNQKISEYNILNFAPFTGTLGSSSPSSNQLGLYRSASYTPYMFFLRNADPGYKWLGKSASNSFTAGEIISATLSYLNNFQATTSLPSDGSTLYFGFKNTSNTNVGWASVTNSSGSYFLTGFGMETGGVGSIAAGATAIPEPAASVALLALGALGIAALRRRNQAKATANAA